jgi:hypothetical protein
MRKANFDGMNNANTWTGHGTTLKMGGRPKALNQHERRQCCSDFSSLRRVRNVLLVGAERPDEFADAMRLVRQGHKVMVVNPHASLSARNFAKDGGTFVRTTIECLPFALGLFNLICENYPYTVARVKGVCEEDPCPVWLSTRAMRAYAMARLKRLAPRGRWIAFTESPDFAKALRSFVHQEPDIRRNFSVRIVSLTGDGAPRSAYPYLTTRFRLIFRRHPPKSRRTSIPAARITYL